MALIASGDEWSARALASVLQPLGYRVLQVATGAAVHEQARSARPDFILIASPLPDLEAVAVCRALRQDPLLRVGLPIIGITWSPLTREQRLDWLRAGGWDWFGFPLDSEELLLRLDAYLGAKREAEAAWPGALVDEATGLYNARGIRRRARELAAEAVRAHAGLACAVFGPEARSAVGGAAAAAEPGVVRDHVAAVLRTHARLSDTVGWWGGGATPEGGGEGADFAVLAPATDAAGAAMLVQRLVRAVETTPPPPARAGSVPTLAVRAGFEALSGAAASAEAAEELLLRASAVLRK